MKTDNTDEERGEEKEAVFITGTASILPWAHGNSSNTPPGISKA
jgi:hypothetical protein